MEVVINKESFLDEFKKLKSIEKRKGTKHSPGFLYIHNTTTNRLACGKEVEMGKLDFTKFTYQDLEDYMDYYEENLSPKVDAVRKLFSVIKSAESVFSQNKTYY